MILSAFAFALGFTVGLRSFMAPAAISIAARWGNLDLSHSWLAFLGYAWTPWLLTGGALGELINDKLPNTPRRKAPVQFVFRVVSGALSDAAVGATSGSPFSGMLAGTLGAVAGTFGGAAARAKLAAAFGGRDVWAGLSEDFVTIVAVLVLVFCIA